MLLFSSFLLPNTPILQSKIQIIFKNLNCFPLYRMIIGTAVFQLLMVGVVALKGSFAASCLVLPLPVVTVFFYLLILQHYIRPSANLSLKAAHSLENPAPNFLQVRYWERKTDDRIFSRSPCFLDKTRILRVYWAPCGSIKTRVVSMSKKDKMADRSIRRRYWRVLFPLQLADRD